MPEAILWVLAVAVSVLVVCLCALTWAVVVDTLGERHGRLIVDLGPFEIFMLVCFFGALFIFWWHLLGLR